MLSGDFSHAVDALGKPLTLIDPLSKAPFPGNRIPLARIDPVAARIAAYYPKPNLPNGANNFIAQANATSSWDNFTLKGDHTFSPRDQLSARTLWRPTTSYDPFTRSLIPTFGSSNTPFELLAGLRYTHIVTPQFIGELSASFSRKTNNQGWPQTGRDWEAEVGFPGATKNPIAMGLPYMDISGYILMGHA